METLLETIETLTRERFPAYADTRLWLEPLEKGGSDRKFYRIRSEALPPLIFVKYGQQKEENRHYVEIGGFLQKAGVRVPKMFLHEATDGRIWMEDLGEIDLWASREKPWSVRRPLYEQTLQEVHRLHAAASNFPEEVKKLGLQPAFDAQLYHWEQDYFFSHCVGRHLGIEASRVEPARARLHAIALELEQLPRCLIHRDFQSQNIVLREGRPCLIDFQGMRFGLPQYDLASLLLDPYVKISGDEQAALLAFYCAEVRAHGGEVSGDFEAVYWLCAAQRLMQALGAYGFLGHEKGRDDFLAHIPVALPRLVSVLKRVGGLDSLVTLLEPAACNAALQPATDAVKNAARSC
jgi:hypothetical protein